MVLVNRAVHGLLLATAGAALAADAAYIRQIEQDRRETDEFLRSERSPLRLVGRFRIAEGRSTVGSDPASSIVLPSRAPLHAGTIDRQGNQFSFEAASGIAITLNGKSASGPLKLQVAGAPKPSDRVSFGDFTFAIRPIGDEFDLLLNDAQSPFLKEFRGATWFPVDSVYRVEAQFHPYENAKTMMMPLTGGAETPYTVSGEVVFQTCRPEPAVAGAGSVRWQKLVHHVSRPDLGQGDLRRRPVSGCGNASRRQNDAGFQQGIQSVLRLRPVCGVPYSSERESPGGSHSGGGDQP